MRWFWFYREVGNNSNFNVYNVVGAPIMYDNKIYGTEANPNYRAELRSTIFETYYNIYPVSGHSIREPFMFILGKADDSAITWGASKELPNATISGKYKFSSVLSGRTYVNYKLPLNYKLTKADGTEIIGDYIKGAGIIGVPYHDACCIQWGSLKNNTLVKMGTGDTSVTSFDLGDFANAVVDFGDLPQNLPKGLVDWIISNTTPIYPYSYIIKSQNGAVTLSSIFDAPAMTEASLSVVGTSKTLTLNGDNGEAYTLQWDDPQPDNKIFLGLSYRENSRNADIPSGEITKIEWKNNIILYEVYATYRPVTTTFDINLYQNSAEVNRVDKTDFLESAGVLSGALREECSIMSPSITFKQTTVPTFNYVYIPPFQRYYYVTGITAVSKDIWRMALSCDVLMTWRDDIKALTAVIARQENSYNGMLIDNQLPAQANQRVTVTEFPAGGFGTTDPIAYPFVLTVVGA